MKKRLLWLLLMPILIWGMSIVNASDTSCWSWLWTVPSTTYASWIVYWCDGEIPIITIYWDDGKWITIKAMNEWTGTVTIWSLNDTGAYWSLYQWWNNYPFANIAQTGIVNISDSLVDASSYAPWTYNSGIWIWGYDIPYWDSSDNRNLWWGSWDEKNLNWFWWYDTWIFEVINAIDRQALCPEWYHIPSQWERYTLLYLWWKNYDKKQGTTKFVSRNFDGLDYIYGLLWTWNRFSDDMQIPFVGYRDFDSTINSGDYGYYWSSTPGNPYWTSSLHPNPSQSWEFTLNSDSLATITRGNRSLGHAVRCFKNSYVKLPKTLNLSFMSDDEEVWTWEVTENMTGAVPEEAKNVTKTWYELLWWTHSGATTTGIFEFETTPISWAWTDESGNVYFIAQWTGIKYSVEFTWTDVEWTMENQTFTYGIAQNLTANAFTKNWYTFSGWTDWTTWYTDGQEVVNLTTTSGDVITLTAQWTKIETKPSWGSSGWGGRSSKTSDTQDSSTSSQNDNKSSSWTDVKDLKW